MFFTAFWQIGQPLLGATFVWDTGTGDGGVITDGTGTWQVGGGNWFDQTNTLADQN